MSRVHDDRLAQDTAQRVKQDDALRVLESYIAISATRTSGLDNGSSETTYRLHTLDRTSHRLLPVLLGAADGGCAHDTCAVALLYELATDYLTARGAEADCAADVETQLGLGLVD